MSLLPRCTCEPHEAMVGRYDEDCARHASVREWLKNRRTPMDRPDSGFTHEWHVAIHQHCSPRMGSGAFRVEQSFGIHLDDSHYDAITNHTATVADVLAAVRCLTSAKETA